MVFISTICRSAFAKLVTCDGQIELARDFGAVDEAEHDIFGYLVGWVSCTDLSNLSYVC